MKETIWLLASGDEESSKEFQDWGAFQSSKTRIWRQGIRVHKHTFPPMRKGHYEGAIIDAAWVYHAPKLIIWCVPSPDF